MTSEEQVRYRIRLAEGFLKEAADDYAGKRWRSCVDNCQLSVENSAKAIAGCFGPIGKGHEPTVILTQVIEGNKEEGIRDIIQKGWPFFEAIGFQQHILSDYGDEESLILPWELFKEEDAGKAVEAATGAIGVLRQVVKLLERTM